MQPIRQKDSLLLILCLTFAIQSILFLFVPKIERYGSIMPLWVSIFLVCAFQRIASTKFRYIGIGIFVLAFLLPHMVYSGIYYKEKVNEAIGRKTSIVETRLAAADWLKKKGEVDLKLLTYPGHVGYPPIFGMPWLFDEIQYPYLDEESALNFKPVPLKELSEKYNYLLVSDKEKEFHLHDLKLKERNAGIDAGMRVSLYWENIYDSLDNYYKKVTFSSKAENYGVKRYDIYVLSPDSFV